MQFQILRPDYVEAQPTPDIGVLRVMLFRACVLRLDRRQLRLVDPAKDRLERDRMKDPFRSTPSPPIGQRLAQLRDLMG